LDNIKQLKINTILDKGLITNTTEIKEQIICEECKQIKYILLGRRKLEFKKEIFENRPDVVKSYEVFGGGLVAARKIIISKRFVQILFRNNWIDNLILEPVELI
jgi:hypothetical protein